MDDIEELEERLNDLAHGKKSQRDYAASWLVGLAQRAFHFPDRNPEILSALESGLDILAGGLSDRNSDIRYNLAQVLAMMGRRAARAVPALVKMFTRDKAELRFEAAVALAYAGDLTSLPFLIEYMQSEGPDCHQAQLAVAELGAAAASAVPVLVRNLNAPRYEISSNAAYPLKEILGSSVVPILVEALGNKAAIVRDQAASALGEMGPAASEALPALLLRVSDKMPSVRSAAVDAIGAILAGAKTIPDELVQALNDPTPPVRVKAAGACCRIDPERQLGSTVLLAALKDPDDDVASDAAYQLSFSINPENAQIYVETLVSCLEQTESFLCSVILAQDLLVRAGRISVQPLLGALGSSNDHVVFIVTGILEKLGVKPASETPKESDPK